MEQAQSGVVHFSFCFKVRRDFIVEDSLSRLELYANEQPEELRKQLVVQFQGEDGLDEGGVSREYFRLIIEKIFSPDFGLFIYDDEEKFLIHLNQVCPDSLMSELPHVRTPSCPDFLMSGVFFCVIEL